MSFFSERLKQLRTESGLTMQELADVANVSKSMISKIESDDVQPTLDVASRLAKAFGKTLSEMLHTAQEMQSVYLPKDEQPVWVDVQHIKRRNISPVFAGQKIEWLNIEIPPGLTVCKCSPSNTQTGERYILVTKGILDIKVNETTYHLKKDDSLYFEASCSSAFYNPGKSSAEFFVVINYHKN